MGQAKDDEAAQGQGPGNAQSNAQSNVQVTLHLPEAENDRLSDIAFTTRASRSEVVRVLIELHADAVGEELLKRLKEKGGRPRLRAV